MGLIFIFSFIYWSNNYLLSVYYVLGSVQSTGNWVENKKDSAPAFPDTIVRGKWSKIQDEGKAAVPVHLGCSRHWTVSPGVLLWTQSCRQWQAWLAWSRGWTIWFLEHFYNPTSVCRRRMLALIHTRAQSTGPSASYLIKSQSEGQGASDTVRIPKDLHRVEGWVKGYHAGSISGKSASWIDAPRSLSRPNVEVLVDWPHYPKNWKTATKCQICSLWSPRPKTSVSSKQLRDESLSFITLFTDDCPTTIEGPPSLRAGKHVRNSISQVQ